MNLNIFYPKNVTRLSEVGVRDPGYEEKLFRIRISGSNNHRIPDPQYWFQRCIKPRYHMPYRYAVKIQIEEADKLTMAMVSFLIR